MKFASAEKEEASAKTLRREHASALHETKLAGGTMSQAKKGNKEKDQVCAAEPREPGCCVHGHGQVCLQGVPSASSVQEEGLRGWGLEQCRA